MCARFYQRILKSQPEGWLYIDIMHPARFTNLAMVRRFAGSWLAPATAVT